MRYCYRYKPLNFPTENTHMNVVVPIYSKKILKSLRFADTTFNISLSMWHTSNNVSYVIFFVVVHCKEKYIIFNYGMFVNTLCTSMTSRGDMESLSPNNNFHHQGSHIKCGTMRTSVPYSVHLRN